MDLQPVEISAPWLAILESLEVHGVQYLVAGSAADAIVEGTPDSAPALVVAPAPFRRNLERLRGALAGLDTRLRTGDGDTLPLDLSQIVNRPAVRWRLSAAATELDVIGSAVGDGEFSVRVWRTRRIELKCGRRQVFAEVEFAAEFGQPAGSSAVAGARGSATPAAS